MRSHCNGVGGSVGNNEAEAPTPIPVSPKETKPEAVDLDEWIEEFAAEGASEVKEL